MKSTSAIQRIHHRLAISLAVLALIPAAAHAATRTKQNDTDNLNLASSWDTLPGAADIAQWDSAVTAANTTVLGADLSWAGIKIVGPGGAVAINSGNTLTVGTSGIDLSAATQDLTLNCGLNLLNSGKQSWKTTTGRTLTVAGAFTHTGTLVDFTSFGSGTLSGLANEASGILGPWATTGTSSGNTLNYVQSTAGAISAYTGQTAATPANMSNVTDPNVNYSLIPPSGTVGAVLTGDITANTLRVNSSWTGSADTIANAGKTITLNGLIGVGSGRTVVSGSGTLVISTTKELVVLWTVGFSAITCPVVDNSPGVPSAVNITMVAEHTFSGNNTYTGGTTVNSSVGGEIKLNTSQNCFGTGPVTINGNIRVLCFSQTNSLTLNGGTLMGGTWAGPVTLAVNTTLPSNTSGSSLTLPNTVSGPGNLTWGRTGTPTLTLSGTNTYTGSTIVSFGTVTLAPAGSQKFYPTANGTCNKITGTGTANLNGKFNIDLTGAAIANGNSWTLVDVTTKTYSATTFAVNGFTNSSGVWTKTDGGNIWTFSQATGKLGLTVSSYTAWATNQGLTGTAGDGSGTDPAFYADPNKDGIQNGMAWILGAGALGNPAANLLKLPAVSRDGTGALVMTFDRLAASAASAPLVVQYGDDLDATPWNNFTVVTSAGTTTDGNGISIAVALAAGCTTDYDRITVTMPASYMATHPKTFARLTANLTP